MLATRISFSPSNPSPSPRIMTPPVEVIAPIIGSVTTRSTSPTESVMLPCTTSTVPAESNTPHREAQDHGDQRNERVGELEEVGDTDQHRYQPDGVHRRLAHLWGQLRAGEYAQPAACQHGDDVYGGPCPDQGFPFTRRSIDAPALSKLS
jgi:hypothetical protein